uniref:DNA 5'-3' helicase DnaB n=1 Tax=Wildemania schizophylla TaxID=1134705 RepID=A0A126G1P9_WILSC|nr:replication helicase subunit [Wildemania schizophylla]AKS28477.1 replication helicase subunit [Wildemania schizophylla]
MGKTAFAINVIRHIINIEKSHVLLFSLEMSTEQLLRRILAQECRLNSRKIQSGQLTTSEWQYVIRESTTLASLNLYIDDSAKISTETIKTRVKFFKLQGKKIEIIIIDYLQLLADIRQANNRSQELSLITRSLKVLAKELNLPILVLSQLNRNLEIRVNKRPLLSDLRESGCISKLSRIYTLLDKTHLFLFNLYYKKIQLFTLATGTVKLFTLDEAYISRIGNKPIYKIITESNKYLELTGNHKIFTLNGWKRCDEVNNHDMMGVHFIAIENKTKKTLLQSFSNLPLTFENLKEVNIVSFQSVFDCTCRLVHNFIVNNFIVHNSIEQDADLVIMIYREGYYNKEAEDQTITEIIIAKHRNGPTGTFQLRFNSELADFSNI